MKSYIEQAERSLLPIQTRNLLPIAFLFAMECTILFLDAVQPLRGLGFHSLLSPQSWSFLPTHVLFPGQASSPLAVSRRISAPPVSLSLVETPLLFAAILLLFLPYLLALRHLPQHITHRYILITTLLLGMTYILIPVTTSDDVFSYIAYARMGVIYYLNPLTTLPSAIRFDPIYIQVYWVHQPSAYGPTWIIITSILQWLTLIAGSQHFLPMVFVLRLFGLTMHLGSTALIWAISGYLQRFSGHISLSQRIGATLAFAWNPLLLFEACINAHNDATILFIVLIAIWFLLPGEQKTFRAYLLAAVMLALATCLKLNIILIVPGLLLFLWTQQPHQIRHIIAATATYLGMIILLYAPFWQNGAIFYVFQVNPAIYGNVNTLPEFLSHLYSSIAAALGHPLASSNYLAVDKIIHTLSIGIFVIIYAILCWIAIRAPHRINTLPGLLRWLALMWLLYCAFGTPWFWPWYIVTFFGLYALIEATSDHERTFFSFLGSPLAVGIFALIILSLYGFDTRGLHSSFVTGLPGLQWTYLRGLWAWILPLLAIGKNLKPSIAQKYHLPRNKPFE